MSIKVSYAGKNGQFEPTDKVSKVTDKLSVKGAVNAQVWTVNGVQLPQLTPAATLASLGVSAGQEIVIGQGASVIQPPPGQQIQPPLFQQPINPQPPQFQQPQQIQQVPLNPFTNTQQQPQIRPVITQPVFQNPQQVINAEIKPQFQAQIIPIPQQKEKSRIPNPNIPHEAQKVIYGFLVKISEQGKLVELTKPNNEFRALFLEENSSKEESLKVIISPNEVHKEPDFSLRIGDSKFGGTKVIFLQEGKGIAIQWHSGFSTKCQFWFDE
ncbi:hypothetical protein pb186bvf_017447 [Paramecium bursaria]